MNAPWDPWALMDDADGGAGVVGRAERLLDGDTLLAVSELALASGYDGAYAMTVPGWRGGVVVLVMPVRGAAESSH